MNCILEQIQKQLKGSTISPEIQRESFFIKEIDNHWYRMSLDCSDYDEEQILRDAESLENMDQKWINFGEGIITFTSGFKLSELNCSTKEFFISILRSTLDDILMLNK